MADLTITGSIYIEGVLLLVGGAGTYMDNAQMTDANIALMTAAWGTPEQGRQFYNTDTDQLELWNGSSRVILG